MRSGIGSRLESGLGRVARMAPDEARSGRRVLPGRSLRFIALLPAVLPLNRV